MSQSGRAQSFLYNVGLCETPGKPGRKESEAWTLKELEAIAKAELAKT